MFLNENEYFHKNKYRNSSMIITDNIHRDFEMVERISKCKNFSYAFKKTTTILMFHVTLFFD